MLDWILTVVNSLGYVGIAFLMFLENLFPPIPSELIMPMAGFAVERGSISFPYVVLAGVVGSVVGALPWYYAGKMLGKTRLKQLADKHGKWVALSGDDIENAQNWFQKHGQTAVLFCRIVPGVRTYISVPAGISEMSLVPFLIYSTIGTTLWTLLLTYAGYVLGQNYDLVKQYVGPISTVVMVAIAIGCIVWIIKRKRQRP